MDNRSKEVTMTRILYRYLLISLLALCNTAAAQVVQLEVFTGPEQSKGKASAFYVGKTDDGMRVFVTAAHVFDGGFVKGDVLLSGEKYPISEPTINDEGKDVAVFETEANPSKGMLVVETCAEGDEIEMPGYGPMAHGRSKTIEVRRGVWKADQRVRLYSSLIISGDSGCPAIGPKGVVGVVVGYDRDNPAMIEIVHSKHIIRTINRRYSATQCGPNGCPIYIRPRIQQPMIGFGLPVGPPRVIHEAVPVPRPPQVYVPQETYDAPARPQEPEPKPDTQGYIGPKGERGERGERGPQGPPGKDGLSVTQEQVEAVVNAWLDANVGVIKGPKGDKGDAGPVANIEQLEKRVTAAEQKKFRILITNGKKVIDDESYVLSNMEESPVILDVNRLRSSSSNEQQ